VAPFPSQFDGAAAAVVFWLSSMGPEPRSRIHKQSLSGGDDIGVRDAKPKAAGLDALGAENLATLT
jgi:hypothetical protein